MNKIINTRIGISKGRYSFIRYQTLITDFNEILELAKKGVDNDGREILDFEITTEESNRKGKIEKVTRSYSPAVIREFEPVT